MKTVYWEIRRFARKTFYVCLTGMTMVVITTIALMVIAWKFEVGWLMRCFLHEATLSTFSTFMQTILVLMLVSSAVSNAARACERDHADSP